MTTTVPSTIVQRLWNYCTVLTEERRLEIAQAVEAGLKRAARFR